MKKFIRFWFPVLIYSAIIFFLSHLPKEQIDKAPHLPDKLVHCVEYAIFGFLVTRAFAAEHFWNQKRLVWLVSILVCTLYGFTDELHQSFVPDRVWDLMDLVADTAGAAIGGAIGVWIYQRRIRNTEKVNVK